MANIKIEVSEEFRDSMDFLKQVIGNKDGEPVKDDNELVEIMIAGFMSMIEQEMGTEAGHHHHAEWDECGCGHDHK